MPGWKLYTKTEFGQTYTFQYPENYALATGGRPFNTNDEGILGLDFEYKKEFK